MAASKCQLRKKVDVAAFAFSRLICSLVIPFFYSLCTLHDVLPNITILRRIEVLNFDKLPVVDDQHTCKFKFLENRVGLLNKNMARTPNLALDSGLDLKQVVTTGSVLHINEDYSEIDYPESEKPHRNIDFIGKPVISFDTFKAEMTSVDKEGLVKKKILEEGGGLPLNEGCTVHIAFSGYWENDPEPFDIKKPDKPLIVDLQENGLLPGLQMAVESMLVGELSVFLLAYDVMYGEFGMPPRIKPKADCAFYIKLIKSTLTPRDGKLDMNEPNMFQRVYKEVKLLYASGWTLYKSNNHSAAAQLFKKAIFMLHRIRLANEEEEEKQIKMLKRLYINSAVCYNVMKQPLRACVACNELNWLNSLWNNHKALFQNARALRMIGQFEEAERRLTRAKKICSESKEIPLIDAEFKLLVKMRNSCNKAKLLVQRTAGFVDLISEEFKVEVEKLVKNFKENSDLCRLTLPEGLNSMETDYIRKVCIRENLFFNKIQKDFALDKDQIPPNGDNADNCKGIEDLIDNCND